MRKRAASGDSRNLVEVLYPSMYFGLERQITKSGNVLPNTTYSVNNVYLNGVRVAALTPDGDTRFYLTDQVDSVSMVLNEAGKPLTSFEYMPYGETWIERVKPELKEKHNPKYNSQELDTETDFYYYNARYYDPEISRFVTADNVIDGEHAVFGWNRYMYVKGNPIRYSDPTGHAGEGKPVYAGAIEKSNGDYRYFTIDAVYTGKIIETQTDKKNNATGNTFLTDSGDAKVRLFISTYDSLEKMNKREADTVSVKTYTIPDNNPDKKIPTSIQIDYPSEVAAENLLIDKKYNVGNNGFVNRLSSASKKLLKSNDVDVNNKLNEKVKFLNSEEAKQEIEDSAKKVINLYNPTDSIEFQN